MNDIVTAVLHRAADDVETRQIVGPFQAGPQTWSAVHAAVSDMITSPAVEHLRRRLKVDQVQFWRADRDECVKALRAAAGDAPLSLAELQDADAHKRLEDARDVLAAVLGYDRLDHGYTISNLCADVRSRLAQNEYEIEQLRSRVA